MQNVITHKKFLKEFILECNNEDVRKIVSALIRKTFLENLNTERHILMSPEIQDENRPGQTMDAVARQNTMDSAISYESSQKDNSNIMEAIETSHIGEFLNFLLNSLVDFRQYYRNIHVHFQNIYRIVKESPYIGEYMLRKGIISKFLNFLIFDEDSESSNEDSKLDMEEEEYETDTELTRNYNGWASRDYSEEDLLKANMIYFWRILSYLIRRASSTYDQPLDKINYSISKEETCLFFNEKNISIFMRHFSGAANRSIVRIYCDLCYQDFARTKQVLEAIEEWAGDTDNDQMAQWLELTRGFLNINDKIRLRVIIIIF